MRRISIHKNFHNKTLHLLVELNNKLFEGLMDISVSMSIMFINVVRELGIIHLAFRVKAYKITSGMVTQAFGWIIDFPVRVADVQHLMMMMIIDIDNNDLLLSLNFLMKIGAMVDVEKGLIQIRQAPRNNIQVLPLNMVNVLHLVLEDNSMTAKNNQGKTLRLWGIRPWEPDEWKEKMPILY